MNVGRLFELVFPENDFENVPDVWPGDIREMNMFVEAARHSEAEKYTAYESDPTPDNEAMWRRAITISKYLQTPRWKNLADRKRESAGYKCEKCGDSPGPGMLDVHHKTYDRLGHERWADLEVLCRSCHEKHHESQK